MDQLRAMTVFVEVNEAGSLSAAARKLGEPLTNISRALSQLETHLGAVLLDRSTRRMALTEAGSAYLKTCTQVIGTLEAAEKSIVGQSAELSGELFVTAPVQFGRLHVLPLVTEFLDKYPRISARVLLLDRVVDLLEEGIDVALRIGELADSTMLATRVAELHLVTCASPDYLKKRGIPKEPSALSRHDCVTFSGRSGGQRWVFKSRRNGRKSVRVKSRLSVNTADAAVEAAVAGIGITRVLSYQAQSALKKGHLQKVLQQFEDISIPAHLLYRPAHSANPRVRAFVKFAGQRIRKLKLG